MPGCCLHKVDVLTICSAFSNEYFLVEYRLIRQYSTRLSRIIVLLFNKLITKQSDSFKSLCRHYFSSLFLPTYEATYNADIESIMTIFG